MRFAGEPLIPPLGCEFESPQLLGCGAESKLSWSPPSGYAEEVEAMLAQLRTITGVAPNLRAVKCLVRGMEDKCSLARFVLRDRFIAVLSWMGEVNGEPLAVECTWYIGSAEALPAVCKTVFDVSDAEMKL